ncbi:MAG: hypothetical protein MPEBLZ_01454 [Candidatus Methanoperedens nitroreducens]|uniref:Uncharacterized protein n=1 Tax=Candidatus Methanoperedens nitratireducens TaxID=1392998 RepID=A0A0N8KR54_9EURY|nr:MAG: hypothetical protein MPEBLZ_01454 [Candidatus Methanoperedens sp. BLZ1]
MLVLSGYSINKINFQYQETGIEFEGVLLSDKKLDLFSIASKTIVDKIDEKYLYYKEDLNCQEKILGN